MRLPSAHSLFSFTSFTDSTAISAQANTALSRISTTCKSNNQPIEVSKVQNSFPAFYLPGKKRKRHGLCAARTGHVSYPYTILISFRARVAAGCVHPLIEPPVEVELLILYRYAPGLSIYPAIKRGQFGRFTQIAPFGCVIFAYSSMSTVMLSVPCCSNSPK